MEEQEFIRWIEKFINDIKKCKMCVKLRCEQCANIKVVLLYSYIQNTVKGINSHEEIIKRGGKILD